MNKKIIVIIFLVGGITWLLSTLLGTEKGQVTIVAGDADFSGNSKNEINGWVIVDYFGDTLEHRLFGHGGGHVCASSRILKINKDNSFYYPKPMIELLGYSNHEVRFRAFVVGHGIFKDPSTYRYTERNTSVNINQKINRDPNDIEREVMRMVEFSDPNYHCNNFPDSSNSIVLNLYKTMYAELRRLAPVMKSPYADYYPGYICNFALGEKKNEPRGFECPWLEKT